MVHRTLTSPIVSSHQSNKFEHCSEEASRGHGPSYYMTAPVDIRKKNKQTNKTTPPTTVITGVPMIILCVPVLKRIRDV